MAIIHANLTFEFRLDFSNTWKIRSTGNLFRRKKATSKWSYKHI